MHSKNSCTNFTLATRKFKRMQAFARIENGIWWIDLAYVDKLAKDNNGVKCFLVRQDPFGRMVDAIGMKIRIPRKQFVHFWLWFKKELTRNNLGWQVNRNWGRVEKTMQSGRNPIWLYKEWDHGCICWTYKTIPESYSVPLLGR